ncbi:MAG: urease accessory protein UreE [Chamaesiphon sp.]
MSVMLTLTQRLPNAPNAVVTLTLALNAEERTRSRWRVEATVTHQAMYIYLPRGTVLDDGDLLGTEVGAPLVRIVAKSEPVFTVISKIPIDLMRAAYHLGNRHVALEITPAYLRLAPDPVLKAMLEKLGLEVKEEIVPFQPEKGAYGQSHAH